MITDKDIAESEIIVNAVRAGRSVKDIAFRVSEVRAESAEQARKEAAERVASAWREHGEDTTLRILRDAILSTVNESFTVAPVSTDVEKLSIAVNALGYVKSLASTETTKGELVYVDFTEVRDALKEIQG